MSAKSNAAALAVGLTLGAATHLVPATRPAPHLESDPDMVFATKYAKPEMVLTLKEAKALGLLAPGARVEAQPYPDGGTAWRAYLQLDGGSWAIGYLETSPCARAGISAKCKRANGGVIRDFETVLQPGEWKGVCEPAWCQLR